MDMELKDKDLEQVNGGRKPVIRTNDRNKLELGYCYKDNALLIPIVRKPNMKICICSGCGSTYRRNSGGFWEED